MVDAAHDFCGNTKRVAVMQPYLFPYFPYVQLLACVEIFVVFDTAQYIERGWANRNVIELEGGRHRFVVPVRKTARDTPFSDIVFADNVDIELEKLRKTLKHAGRNAPLPHAPQRLLDGTFPSATSAGTSFVDAFERMTMCLMESLSFRTTLVRASDIVPRGDLPAQEYIIRLAKEVGASRYVNPIGGAALYKKAAFAAQGLELSFLQSLCAPDDTQDASSGLQHSILHALAYHDPADLHHRLGDHALVHGSDAKSPKD